MDFLDPKRKKSNVRKLLAGYVLMAVAIAMGTLILLFTTYGYDLNRQTGTVIQNGTVFLDSQPNGSNVEINGQMQRDKTASRLVLPGSQQYTFKLTQDGYRDWTRTLSLEGGKIERLTYPLLIPNSLKTTESQLYAAQPGITSQSPDRKWLLVQQPGQFYAFDLYDLSNPANTPTVITIPATVLPEPTKTTNLQIVEWSNDNRRVLLDRTYNDKHEFIMFDTVSVASSLNINATLTVNPTSVSLRDKKGDQVYVYASDGGTIRIGDLKNRSVSGAIVSNARAYKSLGEEIIVYATLQGADPGKMNIRIRENDKASYLLKSLNDGATKYLLDAMEYESTNYFAIGSDTEEVVFLYRDPLPTLKGQSQTPLFVASVLRINNPQYVSFSQSGQFILAQSGTSAVSYDIQNDRQFKQKFNTGFDLTSKLQWIDSHHLVYTDNGQSAIVDYDGSNEQLLVPSVNKGGPYFSPNYENVFTIAPSATVSGRYSLTQTSLVNK